MKLRVRLTSIKSTKNEEDLYKLFDSLAMKKLELLDFDALIKNQNDKIKETESKHKQARVKDIEADKAAEQKRKEDTEFDA
jgi:hypothetical protein